MKLKDIFTVEELASIEAGTYDITKPVLAAKLDLVAAHWQKIHQQEISMMSELCADRILEEREACARECCEFYSIEGIAQKCNAAIRARSKQ